MTFKEKLKEEHPEKVDERCAGGCIGCPSNYGYEENYNCNGVTCKDCWNREMPNKEPKHTRAEEAIKAFQKEFDVHNENVIDKVLEKELKKVDYEQGMNDAWELVKKMLSLTKESSNEIFGTNYLENAMHKFTPQEALAKLKAYEEAQNKIEVGDVVKSTLYVDMNCGVVANITDDKASLVHKDGKFSVMVPLEFLVKTGKHLELASILEQIGE